MKNEKRRFDRINLKVYARGVIGERPDLIDFTATIDNLSEGGCLLELTENSGERFVESLAGRKPQKGAALEFKLVSYVEDNVRLRATLAHYRKDGDVVNLGVTFKNCGKTELEIIRGVMKKRPDLTAESEVRHEAYSFDSIDDFINEITEFTLLVGKGETFYIGGAPYAFAGMHIAETGEIHVDCIERADRRGGVFCPDCRAYIHLSDLL